jgi:homoserine O-acetyltransferase
MKQLILVTLLLFLRYSSFYCQSKQFIAEIGDLKLTSGELIEDCKIGYRTFGKLNNEKSNVIIYPTWFEGTTEDINSHIVKQHFIDTTKYYIITIDALGNGISTSPSNYKKEFPQITIRDMINAEFVLLTKNLNINHIFAAIGGSMGSMQVLEWAVAYPNFMDKIVAYVASPKMTSYDLLWMNTQLDIIETGKLHAMSEKEINKLIGMMTAVIARTPSYVVENINIVNFPEYLSSFDKEPSKVFTIDDYVLQLKAMIKHDISLDFNGSMENAAKAIKAKLFIIVSETDMVVNPSEAIKLAVVTRARKLILKNNCGHLAVSCELDRCRKEIADFLQNR